MVRSFSVHVAPSSLALGECHADSPATEREVANRLHRGDFAVFLTAFYGVADVTAVACAMFVLWGAAWLIGLV
jgi:hypothetical protein